VKLHGWKPVPPKRTFLPKTSYHDGGFLVLLLGTNLTPSLLIIDYLSKKEAYLGWLGGITDSCSLKKDDVP